MNFSVLKIWLIICLLRQSSQRSLGLNPGIWLQLSLLLQTQGPWGLNGMQCLLSSERSPLQSCWLCNFFYHILPFFQLSIMVLGSSALRHWHNKVLLSLRFGCLLTRECPKTGPRGVCFKNCLLSCKHKQAFSTILGTCNAAVGVVVDPT